ncbi:MAG: hypothetical protein PGN21_10480 [Sphingomonas paucimobilis]
MTAPAAVRRAAYIATERRISIAVNAVLSLVFFLLVIGLPTPVPVPGMTGYAVDFVPQSFMIALMSTLVPGLLTAARIRAGRILGSAEAGGSTVLRALLTAIIAALAGGVVAAGLLASGVATLPLVPALIAKILYGAVLAWVVTPIGLRRALRSTELA